MSGNTVETRLEWEFDLEALESLAFAPIGSDSKDGPPPVGPASLLPSVNLGILVGFTPAGQPQVRREHNPADILAARTTVGLHPSHIGRSVVLAFVDGDPTQPVILGLLQEPRPTPLADPNEARAESNPERLVLAADKEIVLRCGQACITLTRAGKVLIQGNYLSSRATGLNRIKGGSVQIN